MTYAHCDVSS